MELTKQQAADYLGIGLRTLIRLTGDKIAHLPKRRKSDKTLYDKAELDRYRATMESGIVSATVTHDAPVVDAQDRALMRRDEGVPDMSVTLGTNGTGGMQAQMLAAFQAMAAPVRLADKLMLSLIEAAQLSNLSRGHLRQAIEDGKLKARIIGRGWRVKRVDLNKYVEKL
jgi:excisionase family DNA binding protein